MVEVAFANWNAVAIVVATAFVLALIWFKVPMPKARKKQIVFIGLALALIVVYANPLSVSCPYCGGGPGYVLIKDKTSCDPCAYDSSSGSPTTDTNSEGAFCKADYNCACTDGTNTWGGHCVSGHCAQCSSSSLSIFSPQPFSIVGACQKVDLSSCSQNAETCGAYTGGCADNLEVTKNPSTGRCYTSSEISAKYNSCIAEEGGDSSGGNTGGTSTEECASIATQKKDAYNTFIENQRDACTKLGNVFYSPASYTCQGFPNTFDFSQRQDDDCPVSSKYLTAHVGCCRGTIIKTSELSTDPIASGDSNNYRDLLGSVSLSQVKIVNDSTCLSRFYKCNHPVVSGSGVTAVVTCADEDVIYCPNGCDSNIASCVSPGTTIAPPNRIDDIVFYIMVGAILLVVVGVVFMYRGNHRIRWLRRR